MRITRVLTDRFIAPTVWLTTETLETLRSDVDLQPYQIDLVARFMGAPIRVSDVVPANTLLIVP